MKKIKKLLSRYQNRDFSTKKYQDLCETLLEHGFVFVTVRDYLESENKQPYDKIVIMRHDVDRKIKNSIKLAEIENELGIKTSYYFRYPYTFIPEKILKIESLGHEIGYHYEVLSKTNCKIEDGILLFEKELEEMRKSFDIKTACMHGSPLSKCDNRQLWNTNKLRDFGIIGEASISIDNFKYLNDTGRTWNNRYNIRDNINFVNAEVSINTTNDLISYIIGTDTSSFYISAHPERWSTNFINWSTSLTRDIIINQGKKALKNVRKNGAT